MSEIEFQPRIWIDGAVVPLEQVLATEIDRGRVSLDLLAPIAAPEDAADARNRFADARSLPVHDVVAAQSAALLDLKRAIGDQGILDGLGSSTQETEHLMRAWPATPGDYAIAATEFEVEGLSAPDFLGWFHGRSAADDEVAMISSNPEHYRIRAIASPPGQDVIETMGLYGGPLHVLLTFHNDPAMYPETAMPDHPIRLFATGRYGSNGDPLPVVALHQFKDTERGLHARLALYFPTSYPQQLVDGHKLHLAIEFHNWFRAGYEAVQHSRYAN